MSSWSKIIPRLKCPLCGFAGKGTRFQTKRDISIPSLPEDSPIYWIAGWHTLGVGTRRCPKCKGEYAVVFSGDTLSVYGEAWTYPLDSEVGKEVKRLLSEGKKE